MRVWLSATACCAALFAAGCGSEAPKPAAGDTAKAAEGPRVGEAKMPEGGLPPFGQRAALRTEGKSWQQKLVPDETAECSFRERPASERPEGWVVTAWSGNMDLHTDGYVLGQDPSAPWIEALWMKNKPVVAAREGMDDLWIEPQGDWGQVLLQIDGDRLTCKRIPKV